VSPWGAAMTDLSIQPEAIDWIPTYIRPSNFLVAPSKNQGILREEWVKEFLYRGLKWKMKNLGRV
jgi:hypothetical protein